MVFDGKALIRGDDLVRKLNGYSMYERAGEGSRYMIPLQVRYGRLAIKVNRGFTAFIKQHNGMLYKLPSLFHCSVQDTMTVIHFWFCLLRKQFKEKPAKSMV